MFVTQHFVPRWKKEWIPLATQQLRLRNLIQILAFSVENNKKESFSSNECFSNVSSNLINESYYFTLHSTIMSAPFYTSEKLKGNSPKWKELQVTSWDGDVCNSVDALVLRLWFSNPKEPKDKVLAVWGVYLNGLTYLGPNLKNDILFKPNSIVFLMPGGYFTDPKCIQSDVKIRYTSISINHSDIRPSYSINSVKRLQSLQQVIKKEVEEVEILKKKISAGDFFRNENRGRTTLRKLLSKHKSKTHHSDLIKVKENIEIAKYRVSMLKEEKNILLQKLRDLNKQNTSLTDYNQLTESKIMENYRILRKEVHSQREWKRSYIDRREKFLHSKAMLSFRTKQLISELNLIYPIEEVSPEKFTICNVHLPNSEDFAGHDDLQISVALGFVSHVVQMISVFMQIPLRYPIIHFGSRSRIIDQITDKIPDSEREFCLFVKGREKLQFHYAVYLLNKNIAQMRWLCGLPTSDLRNTLENLSSLVKIKFGHSNLDQNSRSLSSSTADICSSTLSVSSPLGSVISYQAKKNSRIYHLSDSGMESCPKNDNFSSPFVRKHCISKSIGSSKDLMISVISTKNKNFMTKKKINNNLSFSLDKGLNEYEEICSMKGNGQFGSDPMLNFSVKIQKTALSEAKSKFLKTWNAENQRAPFSDDDSELRLEDFSMKKQNLSPSGSLLTKEEVKNFSNCFEKKKLCNKYLTEDLSCSSKNETSVIELSEIEKKDLKVLTSVKQQENTSKLNNKKTEDDNKKQQKEGIQTDLDTYKKPTNSDIVVLEKIVGSDIDSQKKAVRSDLVTLRELSQKDLISHEKTVKNSIDNQANSTDNKKCDEENSVLVTDNLLENVTSRTEALANQTTCFNRFRTRFKSTLESSN